MKRILQVIGGMNRAGAETMIMNLYRQIDYKQMQFDFLVYSPEIQDYEAEILERGGKVIHLEGCSVWNYASKIKKVLLAYGPYDAIHIHTLHNAAFALLASRYDKNILKIVHSHSTQNAVTACIFKKIYEHLSRNVIKKETQVWLACGEEAGKYLFGEEFLQKGHVLNNGVDLNKYNCHGDVAAELLDVPEEYVKIGSVARLEDVKNHKFMIELAKFMKDSAYKFKMYFVGQGSNLEQIKEQIQRYDLVEEVILLGVREDIPKLMRGFDVFLMPSLFEGNPVTLIEAQATGLPCVISDCITDKIDMGLGLIRRCALDASLQEWANVIDCATKGKCKDSFDIAEQIRKKGYDVKCNVDIIQQIYCGKGWC